ncbi:MAG: flagellar export chaperone FliS [Candidatus Caenarcaniphilales bacterium]|jgi:flagellar protein FliS|nr:flagellar export chaperone FliS [Candidatus Caenarcaniphilales bacterium]
MSTSKFKNSDKFLKNMVESASPMQLVIMLYDGAIQWLNIAKQELKKNKESKLPNWSEFSHQMKMAHEIVNHLQESLDFKHSEDIADRLFALYDFMKSNLIKANAFKDEEKINQVIALLKDLKTHWQDVIKQNNAV